jgi:hypothetical protein
MALSCPESNFKVILDHDDAVAVLNYYCCQPGDFVFRISSDLAPSQGTELGLVCTYMNRSRNFKKIDMGGHKEDVDFVKSNDKLQRVLLFGASSNIPTFVPKTECALMQPNYFTHQRQAKKLLELKPRSTNATEEVGNIIKPSVNNSTNGYH